MTASAERDRSRPRVSVIIPAYNEADHLRECLASLCSQDYPDYEVILVDNASTDQTREVCSEFPKVRYIYFDRLKSSYGARNEGVKHAQGEVIVFFDADQSAVPDSLSRLLEDYVFDDPYHIYTIFLDDDPRVPRLLRLASSDTKLANNHEHRCKGEIRTAYVAVPRALFDELGGFDETMRTGGDTAFFRRAVRFCTVHSCERVGGYHYWARSLKEVLLREERYGYGRCLRAREGAAPMPSLVREAARLLGGTLRKLVAAVLTPVRYRRDEWTERWSIQFVGWLSTLYRFLGMAKYKLGFQRAGDLPPG